MANDYSTKTVADVLAVMDAMLVAGEQEIAAAKADQTIDAPTMVIRINSSLANIHSLEVNRQALTDYVDANLFPAVVPQQ
jgi:hypothetical protein